MKPEVNWTTRVLRRGAGAFGLPLNESCGPNRCSGSRQASPKSWMPEHRRFAPRSGLLVPQQVVKPGVKSGALLIPLVLAAVFGAATAAEAKVRLECTPRTFQVVPGEPMRLKLTVRADSTAAIRLHVPEDPLLKLRALEKLPVRRTPEGVIVHRRVVVWQALEPGSVKMDRLAVETKGETLRFPEVTITVRDPGP